MGRTSKASSVINNTVAWDRNTKNVAPVVGGDVDVVAKTSITLHVDGRASVSVSLDAKELIAANGRIDNVLPASVELTSVQLIDAKESTWTPRAIRVAQSVGAHSGDVAQYVGKAARFELAGGQKIAGVVESVSENAIVVCAADGALHLVARSKINHSSLPGLLGLSVFATLGDVGESFAPVLTFVLPAGALVAVSSFNAEIDRNDTHLSLVGSWRLTNKTSVPFENARVFVERTATTATRFSQVQSRNKMFIGMSSSSMQQNNKSNVIKKMRRRNSGGSSSGSDSDEDAGGRVYRFQVPGLVSLKTEANGELSGDASLVVPFGSLKTACVVRNVAEFAKKSKSDTAHSDTAQARFAVEFVVTAESFGKVLPGGVVTLWRAAHKSEPRRLITAIDEATLPTVSLPHWMSLNVPLDVHVTRHCSALTMLRAANDVEANKPLLAEQMIKFEFPNRSLPKDAVLVIVDQDLQNFTRHAPSVPVTITAEHTEHGSNDTFETDLVVGAHEFHQNALVISVPITSKRSTDFKFNYKVMYEIEQANAAQESSATSGDSSAAPAATTSSSSSGSTRLVSSSSKAKKSSWW